MRPLTCSVQVIDLLYCLPWVIKTDLPQQISPSDSKNKEENVIFKTLDILQEIDMVLWIPKILNLQISTLVLY